MSSPSTATAIGSSTAWRSAGRPPTAGRQHVKVSWALQRADGSEIGEVSQENAVPAGSLDGPWGDIAFAVANAAAPGVAELIQRAKAVGTGS